VYSLREIRLLLYDRMASRRFHLYGVAVSADGETFTPLADRSKGQWYGWQVIRFAARPVKAIRLFGLNDTGDRRFLAVELEAYCIPPATAPGAQVPPPDGVQSKPRDRRNRVEENRP
jgi:hypothetical protein